MKKNTYPAFYRLPARYTFALLAMAGSASVAMADGKISMDAFSLAPGQTVTVAVNLEQTGDIYGLQANVALPNGLKLVDAKADEVRVEDKVHTFQYKQNGDGYIFLITPDKSRAIYGNSGMLFELTLEADGSFAGGDIQFSNVVLSNTSAEKTVQDDFSVSVTLTQFTVGDFSVAADLLTITENGGPYMVEVLLDNKIPVKGLQGTISLPDGLSIKKDSKGYPIFINGERLTESASLDYNEENGRFVLVDQKTPDFWGYGGVLFSFEVVPDESKLAKTSEIVLGSFTISTANNASVDFDQRLVVTVDNSAYFKAGFEQFLSDINAVRQDCQDAMNAIQANYNEEVAAKYVPQLENLLAQLDKEAERIQQEQEAGKSPSEVELNLEPYTEGITLILADARTAQSDIIYANYEATLKELAAAYAAVEQELKENYADIAASFDERMAAVAENLAMLTDALAEAKQQHVPGMELQFGAAEFKMVADEIAAILEEAKDKQNLLSYDGMEQLILKLQASCAEAIDYVKTYCPDADRVYAARLDNYKHEIMDWAGIFATGKAHNTPIDELGFTPQVYDELKAKIQTALDDAKNAQSEYLYGTFETKLAELSANCADTKAYIETFLPNVAGQYAATMEKAAQDIKNFENTIKNFKAAGKLALDLTFGMADLEAVDQQMKDVLEEAKSAESAYLYTEFDKALAQLATDLADTKEALNNYPDVKAGFAGRMADVEATLAEVKAFIEESKAAGTLAMELTSAKEALQAMDAELASILAEAKAAQSDFAYAEFDKALAQLATDLADTKEALNNYPDVKDNFAERMAAVETALAEVKAFIEESKAAGADASDLTSAKEALQAMDAELASILAEAKAAQSDFAYAEFDKALAQLAIDLADTKEALNNYPDVKDNFAGRMAAVEAALAEVKAFIEESKAAGADATDLTSAKEAIQAMDAELASILAEAKAAQSDFAYAEFDKALTQLATALADTKETLDNCPDVKGLFAERMAAVEAALAEVQAFIEESKAAGADATDLTSAKEALQAMEAELAAIQAEAKATQEEYTALYADYTAQVDEVQAALEEAVKYIENECADVADNYKDRAEEIQAMIDAVKADVEAAKTSGNLFDFVFSVADIKVAIDEMLQAAIDEQQTVGIGLIELDGEQPVRIYSTSGVQSDKVIKGKVNIVHMPDGTVKKIFVK